MQLLQMFETSIVCFSMGYEAMGVWDYPEDTRALHLLLETERAPRMDFVVNCMSYTRLQDEQNCAHVRCIGEHYLNLNTVLFLNEEKMKGDLESIKTQLQEKLLERTNETHPEPIQIGFMSRQGRHRSIAVCRFTIEVLKRKGYNVAKKPVHLSQSMWEPDQCSTCEECDANCEGKEFLYEMAVQVWNSLPGY